MKALKNYIGMYRTNLLNEIKACENFEVSMCDDSKECLNNQILMQNLKITLECTDMILREINGFENFMKVEKNMENLQRDFNVKLNTIRNIKNELNKLKRYTCIIYSIKINNIERLYDSIMSFEKDVKIDFYENDKPLFM